MGRQYRYRIQAVNRDGAAGPPSTEAVVDLVPAPAPPGTLSAAPGDGTVILEWTAPSAEPRTDAPPVRGYNVYRGVRPGAYEMQPVNATPHTDTRFRDTGIQNETTYYYIVRSVTGDRPPWRESADSPEVAVTLRDLVPPAPPRGLVAVPGAGAVALAWEANTEADLLGYVVYRREPPLLVPVRLTETPIGRTTFTDGTVRPGATYLYVVTAVDRSARRNESDPSAEISVTLP
jgi:fibronectin type 3 domain-containing protein